jgi:hypothetical protein
MADIHILNGDGGGSWTYVFHVAVPDTTNAVSVSYRTALVNSSLGGVSVMDEGTGPGQITTAELAQLAAGELFEFSRGWLAESGATNNAQLLVNLRAEYVRVTPLVLSQLQNRLKYYGWSGASE